MKKDMQLMDQIPLFQSLRMEERKKNLQEGRFRVAGYDPGRIIHLEGDSCTNMEVVLEGTLVVERIDVAGDVLTVAEFKQGDVLGGNLIFADKPQYPMTITARSRVKLLEVNKKVVLELCLQKPLFLEAYLALISNYTFLLGEKIKHDVRRPLRDKVISYLAVERQRQQSNSVQLPMTKKALAERFGVQRTSLSRELQKMKQEGLLDYDAHSITLKRSSAFWRNE
ncbi:MAG: Crp/Fnr family transcriptional regulator [Bacillota bacterium]|nr:Crp/Fnr family transcriptional regulator [Bacillota bacterium]